MHDFPRVLLLALAVALPACQKAASAPPAKTWYDPNTLLVSLVPEDRKSAEAQSDQLPFYDLELGLNEKLDGFRLNEVVYFTNDTKRSLDEVVLRLFVNATAPKALVTLGRGACKDATCAVTQPEPSVIVVKPAKAIEPGGRLRVRLELTGTLPEIEASRTTLFGQGLESLERMSGASKGGDYGLLARGDDIASLASFFPIVARRKGDAWVKRDESTMGDLGAAGLSHVRLRLVVPSGAKVATTGIITRRGPYGSSDAGPREELRIVAGMVRDFSLLVSQRFEVSTRTVGNVVVRSHYLGRDKSAGDRVLDYAAASLAVFEKRFGRYPYRDLDVVEAPLVGGAGGVEFSGLVTVASMLYRPVSAGALGALAGLLGAGGSDDMLEKATGSMLEFTTAHEVAHQWFPGLVGSDSREHPYLDESLAQYSAVIYFIDRYDMARAKQEASRQVAMNYQMMRMLGNEDAPADRPVEAFDSEIAYAGLVYGKAPYLWSRLKLLVGDAEFFAALSSYVDKHRFKSVAPRALVEELAKGEKAGEVRALARRWLDEAHGDEDLGKLDMRQMIGEMIGPEAALQMGPELDMAMKLMLQLFGGNKGEPGDLLQQLLAPGGTKTP